MCQKVNWCLDIRVKFVIFMDGVLILSLITVLYLLLAFI